jgi:hypothetical protein
MGMGRTEGSFGDTLTSPAVSHTKPAFRLVIGDFDQKIQEDVSPAPIRNAIDLAIRKKSRAKRKADIAQFGWYVKDGVHYALGNPERRHSITITGSSPTVPTSSIGIK